MIWILSGLGLVYFLLYKGIFAFIAYKKIAITDSVKRLITALLIVVVFYPVLAYIESTTNK